MGLQYENGDLTTLATFDANGDGEWISGRLFAGSTGECTIRCGGYFGGGTVTIYEAEDSAGTNSMAIDTAAYTAAFTKKFSVSRHLWYRASCAGATLPTLAVLAAPHGV